MGRRSVRKPDPQLDLAGYLLEVEQLGQPLDAAALFGRVAPLEIEVGSGKGLFLQTAAQKYPDTNFLGIELAAKYARHAAGRLAKYRLTNGKLIAGDALRVFREHLSGECADAVHVYFPDPWWKKRHKKRRVMTAEFIRDLHRVLKPGGTLHFWTDVEEYFQTTLDLIAAESLFSAPIAVPESAAEHDLDFRTHFERRMRMHELPVYRSQFRKLA